MEKFEKFFWDTLRYTNQQQIHTQKSTNIIYPTPYDGVIFRDDNDFICAYFVKDTNNCLPEIMQEGIYDVQKFIYNLHTSWKRILPTTFQSNIDNMVHTNRQKRVIPIDADMDVTQKLARLNVHTSDTDNVDEAESEFETSYDTDDMYNVITTLFNVQMYPLQIIGLRRWFAQNTVTLFYDIPFIHNDPIRFLHEKIECVLNKKVTDINDVINYIEQCKKIDYQLIIKEHQTAIYNYSVVSIGVYQSSRKVHQNLLSWFIALYLYCIQNPNDIGYICENILTHFHISKNWIDQYYATDFKSFLQLFLTDLYNIVVPNLTTTKTYIDTFLRLFAPNISLNDPLCQLLKNDYVESPQNVLTLNTELYCDSFYLFHPSKTVKIGDYYIGISFDTNNDTVCRLTNIDITKFSPYKPFIEQDYLVKKIHQETKGGDINNVLVDVLLHDTPTDGTLFALYKFLSPNIPCEISYFCDEYFRFLRNKNETLPINVLNDKIYQNQGLTWYDIQNYFTDFVLSELYQNNIENSRIIDRDISDLWIYFSRQKNKFDLLQNIHQKNSSLVSFLNKLLTNKFPLKWNSDDIHSPAVGVQMQTALDVYKNEKRNNNIIGIIRRVFFHIPFFDLTIDYLQIRPSSYENIKNISKFLQDYFEPPGYLDQDLSMNLFALFQKQQRYIFPTELNNWDNRCTGISIIPDVGYIIKPQEQKETIVIIPKCLHEDDKTNLFTILEQKDNVDNIIGALNTLYTSAFSKLYLHMLSLAHTDLCLEIITKNIDIIFKIYFNHLRQLIYFTDISKTILKIIQSQTSFMEFDLNNTIFDKLQTSSSQVINYYDCKFLIETEKASCKLICVSLPPKIQDMQNVVDGLFLLKCVQSHIAFKYHISSDPFQTITLVMITVSDIFYKDLLKNANSKDVFSKLIKYHGGDPFNPMAIITEKVILPSNPHKGGVIRHIQNKTLDLKQFHNEMFLISRQIKPVDMSKYLSINNSNVLSNSLSKLTTSDLTTYIRDIQDTYNQNTILFCYNEQSFLNLLKQS